MYQKSLLFRKCDFHFSEVLIKEAVKLLDINAARVAVCLRLGSEISKEQKYVKRKQG